MDGPLFIYAVDSSSIHFVEAHVLQTVDNARRKKAKQYKSKPLSYRFFMLRAVFLDSDKKLKGENLNFQP